MTKISIYTGRDKKTFFGDHCKEIEENNRMRKTRDLFKKIRDTKGTFQAIRSDQSLSHVRLFVTPWTAARQVSLSITNSRSLPKLISTESVMPSNHLILCRPTEELYKKDLHDPDNHNGVITHPERDILECKFKWALGSTTTNKASGGDEIPAELF